MKWENIYYPSGALKYKGFVYFDSKLKELVPTGQGLKYFENGSKQMEGNFGNDWFIETGTEYYSNGASLFTFTFEANSSASLLKMWPDPCK